MLNSRVFADSWRQEMSWEQWKTRRSSQNCLACVNFRVLSRTHMTSLVTRRRNWNSISLQKIRLFSYACTVVKESLFVWRLICAMPCMNAFSRRKLGDMSKIRKSGWRKHDTLVRMVEYTTNLDFVVYRVVGFLPCQTKNCTFCLSRWICHETR